MPVVPAIASLRHTLSRGRLLRTASVAAVVTAMLAMPAQAQLVRLRGGVVATPAAGGAAAGGVAGRSLTMRQALDTQKTTQQEATAIRSYVLAARQAAAASGVRNPNVTNGISAGGLYPIASIREAMRLAATGAPVDATRSADLLIAARAANDGSGKATWDGASLPTVDATNTKVEIVQNQARALLSWERFDVGAGTTLNFKQQENGAARTDWIAVNRVVDAANPTTILGKLSGDGQVYILNNRGVIFGKGSQVNLRSLVASSLELGNYATRELFTIPGDGTGGNKPVARYVEIFGLAARNSNFLQNGPLASASNAGLQAAPPLFLSPAVEGGIFNINPLAQPTAGPGAGVVGGPRYLPPVEGDVIVDPGATITTSAGGAIILAAPKVQNDGVLTATDGQVSLIGGRIVAFQKLTGEASSLDPNVRGLNFLAIRPEAIDPAAPVDAERDDGLVINRGLIQSNRGYLSLATSQFGSVVNDGLLAATTSVSRNGKIGLYAGRVTIGSAQAGGQPSGIVILPDETGETIPQGSDAEPANFKRSQIEFSAPGAFDQLVATNLVIGDDAVIYAPNGDVSMTSRLLVENLIDPSVLAPLGTSVTIGRGAVIDVSGLKDVGVNLSRNFVTIDPVKRNELRDTPNYREVATANGFTLNGTTLTVDIRRTGVRADGVRWVGSPLLEAGSVASQIPVTVSELMTAGGNITLEPKSIGSDNLVTLGNVALGKGATLDFSGGWVRYDAATVSTSRLVTRDGRIVDIANADPNDEFVAIYQGFNDTQPRFGVSNIYNNPIISGARNENGYDEGRNAGSLLISASTSAIDGSVVGNAFAGERQVANAQRPTGAAKISGDPRKLAINGNETPAGGYFKLDAGSIGGSDIVIYRGTLGSEKAGLAQSLLNGAMLSAAGLSALTMNTSGAVTFAGADTASANLWLTSEQRASGKTAGDIVSLSGPSSLTLAPGGMLSVTAGRTVRVDGDIYAPSGTISIATTNAAGQPTGFNISGNVFRSDDDIADAYAIGAALPSVADIRVNGTISAAGLWVNEFADGGAGLGRAWINGGAVRLTVAPNLFAARGESVATAQLAVDLSGSIDINASALIDVSAGGYVRADQSINLSGKGGSVALDNGTYYASRIASERNRGAPPVSGQLGNLSLYGTNQTVGFTPLAAEPFPGFLTSLVPGLVPDLARSHVSIADGTIAAFGFTGSGTFTLVSPDVTFGSDARRSGATHIGLDFLAQTGFGGLDLTANRSIIVPRLFANGTNYNSAFEKVTSFTVRGGETLNLTQTLFPLITARQDVDSLLDFGTGGSLRTLAALAPVAPADQAAFDRLPVSLTIRGPGELFVEQGGTVTGAANGSVQVTKLVNAGTIALSGGNIRQIELGRIGAATTLSVASLSQALGGPVVNGQYLETALNAAGIRNSETGALLTNAQLFTTSVPLDSQRQVILRGEGTLDVGIELRAGSVTDLSGTALFDPRARFIRDAVTGETRQVRSGRIVAGGSIATASPVLDEFARPLLPVGRQLNALPGSKLDLSGTRATFDRFVSSQGYSARDEWSAGGRFAALAGGTIAGALVNAYGGYADDGGAFARSGTIDLNLATPQALGGTLEWLRPTIRAIDPGVATSNAIFADNIDADGFDTLIVRNGAVFDGNFALALDKAFIATGNVTTSGALQTRSFATISATGASNADLSAPYIRFESVAALAANQQTLPNGLADVSFAAGALGFDFVGSTQFDGSIGKLAFVTPGDVRFTGVDARTAVEIGNGTGVSALNGEFRSYADTLFDAGRVYATTGTGNLQAVLEFEANPVGRSLNPAYRPYLVKANGLHSITFGGSFINREAPLTAGSFLRVDAQTIAQNGHLAAPIGRLEIGRRTSEAVVGIVTVILPPTQSLSFGAGSLTTVAGGSTPVPYGTTLDLKDYFFTPFSNTPLTVVPNSQLTLSGAAINVAEGAVVNLKGGGDVFAYEFVSGVGGSRDVLSRTSSDVFSSNSFNAASGLGFQYADQRQVYAILPRGQASALAPFDPIYSADYGRGGPSDLYGANAGLSVRLDGTAGVPAGDYVLLPAHYALLPGAFRVVENVGLTAPADGSSETLLDGSTVVAGNYVFAGTALSDSTRRSFTIQSRATFDKASRIEVASGSETVKALAERADRPIPRLPIDAARLILSPLTELRIAGFFDTSAGLGRGSEVDITGDRIVVAPALTNGQPTAATPGLLTLFDSTLENLNAVSLLIGGTRAPNGDGTTDLRIDANLLTIKSGVDLAKPELIFAVGNQLPDGTIGTSNLTIESGATLRAVGTLAGATGADYIINSGDGAVGDASGAGSVLRLANGPDRLIRRVGDVADENTRRLATLTIGAATLTGDGAPAASIGIESSQNFTVAPLALLDARNIVLSSDSIRFDGRFVTAELLATLGKAERLTLVSPAAISFAPGTYAFNDLVIDAPSLTAISTGPLIQSTDIRITAANVRLSNSAAALNSCITTTCGRANTNLSITARGELAFGGGIMRTLNVGGNVALTAPQGVYYENVGRFDTGTAALRIFAPSVADRAASADPRDQATRPDFTLASNAAISITAPDAGAVPTLATLAGNRAPGAALRFAKSDARSAVAGQALDVSISDALITASAGVIDILAERNITIAGSTTLATPGFSKAFGDALDRVVVAAPGGAINLTAQSGNIAFVQGQRNGIVTRSSLISDSGPDSAGSGDAIRGAAGAINLIASRGTIDSRNANNAIIAFDPLLNPGVSEQRLGDFRFDSGRSAFDFSAFVAKSGSLFGGDIVVRSSAGDLALDAGQSLNAESVSLTADGGRVTIGGKISTAGVDVSAMSLADASKARVAGGAIELYGQQGVALAATARLDTRTSGYAALDARSARAGDVTLGIGDAAGAVLTIAAGAVIDVSATRTAANIAARYAKDTGRYVAELAKEPGTFVDRTVYRFVEADVGGTITLRAPLIGAGLDKVNVTLPGQSAFVGADEVQLAAVRRYDLNALAAAGTVGVTRAAGNDIVLDPSAGYNATVAYSGNLLSSDGVGSISHFVRNFAVSSSDVTTSLAGMRLRPGVELVSTGAISLNSNWNLAAARIDERAAFNAGLFDVISPLGLRTNTFGLLVNNSPYYALKTGREAALLEGVAGSAYTGANFLFRVGGKASGEAPLIDFRARGDVVISRTINDGFFVFGDKADAAYTNFQQGGGDRAFNPALTAVCSTAAAGANSCTKVANFFTDPVAQFERNDRSLRISMISAITGSQQTVDSIATPYSAEANSAAALGTAIDSVTGRPVGASLTYAELFPVLSTGAMKSSDFLIAAGADARLSANPGHVDISSAADVRVVDGVLGATGEPVRPAYRLEARVGRPSIAGNVLEAEFGTGASAINYALNDLPSVVEAPNFDIDALDGDSYTILNWGGANQGSFALAVGLIQPDSANQRYFVGRTFTGFRGARTGVIAPLSEVLAFLDISKAEYLRRLGTGQIASVLQPLAAPVSFANRGLSYVQTDVRSGDGAITLAAAADVDLRGSTNAAFRIASGVTALSPTSLNGAQVGGTSVYTAGQRLATNATVAGRFADGEFARVSLTSPLLVSRAEDTGKGPSPYGISYRDPVLAHRGGDVAIAAGKDVLGRFDEWSERFFPSEINAADPPIVFNNAGNRRLDFLPDGIGLSAQLWRRGTVAESTEFGIAPQYFSSGVGALAGGNVAINAGRDVRELSIALDTSLTSVTTQSFAASNALITLGGGDLSLNAGNDIIATRSDITSGQARINAGRAVAEIPPTAVAPKTDVLRRASFRLENATVALAARGNINNIAATTLARGGSVGILYSAVTSFDAASLGAVSYAAQILAPPSLGLASLTSGVSFTSRTASSVTTLFPSPIGQLSILSAQDIGNFAIAMLDFDPSLENNVVFTAGTSFPGISAFPGVNDSVSELARRQRHNDNITHRDDFVPARIFTDGSINGVSVNLAKQGSIIAGGDIVDSFIVGQNVRESDLTRVVAGRDITATTQSVTASGVTALPFFGANGIYVGGPGTLSVEAGRDLGPFATSAVIAGQDTNFRVVDVTYPGGILTVGNDYNPWLPAAGADLNVLVGVAPGIDYAALRETYLNPANSAKLDGDLFVQVADVQNNLRPDRTRPVYAPILATWLRDNAPELFRSVFGAVSFASADALATAAYPRAQALFDAFATLPAKNQQPFLIKQLYFNELEQASLPTSPSFQQYIRGYRAIEALFPTRLGYTDNLAAYDLDPATISVDNPLGVPRRKLVDGQPLVAKKVPTGNADLRFAAFETLRGGDLTILAPGGDILAGSVVRTSEQPVRRSTRFFNSSQGSDATKLVEFGGLAIQPSRIKSIPTGFEGILTLRQGDIRYFSDGDFRLNQSRMFTVSTGNISAWSSNGDLNAGQGPKSAANFPPVTVKFDLNGNAVVDTAGGIVGAGIGAFKQNPSDPNSRIILIAPVGEVDAGDAGVRASGDIFVAAARVANADNFAAGGTLSGVPTSAIAAAPAVPASAGSALAAIVKNSQPPRISEDLRSMISVDILGYAGGERCLDPLNTDPNCPK